MFKGLVAVATLVLPVAAGAGPIGRDAFRPTDPTETFDSLATSTAVPCPLVLAGNTYETSSGTIRLFSPATDNSAGQCYPQYGTCLGTGLVDLEAIWVQFGTPVPKAGLLVGLGHGDAWSATVWFLSGTEYLGSVDVVGPGHAFVGWESKDRSKPITRIVVEDTASNGRVIAIDGVVWSASAPERVTFEFSMTVTETMTLPPIAQVGDVVSGSFTFDSTAPDSNPLPSVGSYPITGLVVNYSGIAAVATGGRIDVVNDGNCPRGVCDSYAVLANFGPYAPYPSPSDFFISFYDYSATLFSSDVLPLAPPVPSGLTGSLLVNADGNGGLWPANGIETLILSLADEQPLSIALELDNSLVAGCKSVKGSVDLGSPAPAGGAIVSVSDTLASATPPATVTIAEGATSKSFAIKTAPVASSQSGAVTVSLGGVASSQPLTVRPMGLSSVKLSPTTVVGGHPSTGTATLECAAGPGPVTVDLSTSNAAVASTVAPTVVVPQGLNSQTFTVATNPVLDTSNAMITGDAGTTTKSRRLKVVPAAVVSPTRLSFGSIPVGQISGAMTATLRNDGVVPFAVTGINLTGTYASWFAQTNNCPASLPAGASCTVSVLFTPQAALSKPAKLSITTSATSTPLSVSLTGTGILPP